MLINSDKKADQKRTSVIGAVMIVLVAVLVVLVNKGIGKQTDSSIDGTYKMEIASGDENQTVFEMIFNAKEMTYEEKVEVGKISQTITQGTYEVKDDKVTTTSELIDTEGTHFSQEYYVEGKYLVVADYLYSGEIPNGDTFDATCTYTNSENVAYKIEFNADGTYTEDNDGEITQGTYKRDGQIIKRTDENGSDKIDFLIYHGQITNSYYIAD